MSFTNNIDRSKLQENAKHVEINRLANNARDNVAKSQEAEIFTKIIYGKDVSKYGKKVDAVMETIKNMANEADNGNGMAQAELNAIRTITIQQPLEQRLSINSVMGNTTTVAPNEELRYEVYELQGDRSREQASSGSFVFPTVKKRTGIMTTKTATGGVSVNYRELQSGAVDGLAYQNEQVITDIINRMVLSHINALRTAIQNASTLKNYSSGITKTNVEATRKLARRFGNVTIMGDYSAVNKLGDLASFQVTSTSTDVLFPEFIMQEVMKTGLISSYKGSPVIELPNAYDLTSLNTAGDFYNPLLPTSDLWFVPQGKKSPLQIAIRKGLMSMTALDLNTRSEITVYDLEYGNYVVPEYIPMLGYIYDSSLDE